MLLSFSCNQDYAEKLDFGLGEIPWKFFGYSIFKEKNVSIKVYVLLSLTLLLEKHFLMAEAKYPKFFYSLEFCFESKAFRNECR
jgi:hypothetical protein